MRTIPLLQLAGLRFGRFTVLHDDWSTGDRLWKCRCDCGEIRFWNSALLKSGKVVSCGCNRREKALANFASRTTHGLSKTAAGRSWKSMLRRWYGHDPKHLKRYAHVRVCEFLRVSPANLIMLIGERPSGTTLDRTNNNGNYSCGQCKDCLQQNWPLNVRWATRKTQQRNRYNNKILTINGESKCVSEWAEDAGLIRACLESRLQRGWSGESLLKPHIYSRSNQG